MARLLACIYDRNPAELSLRMFQKLRISSCLAKLSIDKSVRICVQIGIWRIEVTQSHKPMICCDDEYPLS